jgi:multidrug efflux pump subunit AcrA (membrane-fusion protein)
MLRVLKTRKFWVLLLLLPLGLFGGLAATGRLPVRAAVPDASKKTAADSAKTPEEGAAVAKRPAAPVAVTVSDIVRRPVQRSVKIVGTLQGYDEIQISPLVDGRIARIRHDVGDVLRPGEPLLEIDDSDYRMAVEENQRALELELSKLGLQEPPKDDFDINALPSVVRAKLTEDNMSATLERFRGLLRQKVTTQEEFERAETNFRVAQADTKQRIFDARQTLASVKHRQALLETSRKKLRDTRVLVPELPGLAALDRREGIRQISGQKDPAAIPTELRMSVAERFVSEGEVVKATPPTKLFRLVIENPLKLMAAVPERYVGQLKLKQRVEILVEAYPGKTFTGLVSRVSPAVDRVSRTFQIQVLVPNTDRRLLPGCFATAHVVTGEEAAVPMVPEAAVVKFAGVTKIFVAAGGTSRGIPVELGSRLEERQGKLTVPLVEIIGDIPADAKVVVTGHSQLADGTPVRIRD